jgi:pilus assembly protein CpaB
LISPGENGRVIEIGSPLKAGGTGKTGKERPRTGRVPGAGTEVQGRRGVRGALAWSRRPLAGEGGGRTRRFNQRSAAMKQKNLVMLGVAVGCGLVAAIAVAKLSAGSSKAPDTIKVLVAKKDLPVQTKLDAKELDNLLTWADMPRGLVPADAVASLDDVKDKELNRTLKTGNPVAYSDLGIGAGIALPDGHKQITFRSSQVDAVAGFVRPGSKVDVMYVERTAAGKARAAIILKDMLVLAVNMTDRLKDGQGPAIPQVESVSLAVTDKQATILALAEDKGKLKLVLRGTDKTKSSQVADTGGADNIEWLEDPFEKGGPAPPPPPPASNRFDTAVIAKKPVPVNTLINSDNVAEYFDTLKLESVPGGVIQNADDLKGKYIIKALDQGQYVYKSLTGNDPVDVKGPAIPIQTGPVAPPPPVAPDIKAHNRRLPRFEQTIQEGGRSKKVIWMQISADPVKWKRFDNEAEADNYRPEPEPTKPGTGME